MPINIDEVVTEIAPPPAMVNDTPVEPAAAPAAPDPVALAQLLAQLAWRAARVAAD